MRPTRNRSARINAKRIRDTGHAVVIPGAEPWSGRPSHIVAFYAGQRA